MLASDSTQGAVWRIDTKTGAVDKPFTDPLLGVGDPQGPPVGVNGVHARGDALFFTSSNRALYGRIDLTDKGAPAAPARQIFATTMGMIFDDFALMGDGKAYFANILVNEITRMPKEAVALKAVVGLGELMVSASTSVEIVPGKGGQGDTLYIMHV